MNAKEEGIIHNLNEFADMQGEIAKEAMANGHMDAAAFSLIIAKTAADAAEIIKKQAAELEVLRAQSDTRLNLPDTRLNLPDTGLNLSDTGRCIYIIGSELQYIIIAELQNKYLILPYPIKESEILTNLRLIERSFAVFIDDAQRAALNA
ncbi:hypothetical protein [Escherichia albertii]|uniref:hypothetical protein n=1 Tax=Escherichia albertii TaxID=208962 RepID=UPI000BF93441|nr:hypothetical protein [Escherichia albertii]PFF94826.1 hypothetical protein CRH02_16530 [Escherichia albertii]